jgi:ferredoxin
LEEGKIKYRLQKTQTCIRIMVLRKALNIISKEEKQMAYKISDECIMCGTCEGECPVGAIAEGEGKYEIDADACIECGSCAAACPVGAINE